MNADAFSSPELPDDSRADADSVSGSAFPPLSANLTELPAIPGGWKLEQYDCGGRPLLLQRPADPDLFLDDPDVVAANARNDYMPYWAFLWPSAVKMAQTLTQAPWPVGSRVLELGAGLGLVGLAAMLRGDQVTFSDYDATALQVCRINAILNGLPDPPILQLDWREPTNQQFDVIIGCEVTYDGPLHGVLLDLLDRMLAPGGVCWLADPGRYQSQFFYELARKRGYAPILFDEQFASIDAPSTAGFQIFQLTKGSACSVG